MHTCQNSAYLRDAITATARKFGRGELIARAGQVRDTAYQIDEGWACGYEILPNGRRQITAFYLPGDFCDPQWILDRTVRQPIRAINGLRVTEISLVQMQGPSGRAMFRRAAAALLETLDRQSALIVGLGCKSAAERISDFLCDIYQRLAARNMVVNERILMPLTQVDLADAVGLTSVHVNRVLKRLRTMGVIETDGPWLAIPNLDGLRTAGQVRK